MLWIQSLQTGEFNENKIKLVARRLGLKRRGERRRFHIVRRRIIKTLEAGISRRGAYSNLL